MKKIIVTGAGGLLGTDIVRALAKKYEVIPVEGRKKLDLTDFMRTLDFVKQVKPQALVHSAGIRDVDECELDPIKAYRINVVSTRNLCLGARHTNAHFMYISSDNLFNGRAAPYHEFSQPSPINVYGYTKWQAEKVVRSLISNYYIIRTPVLFGRGRPLDNRVLQMIEELKKGKEFKASTDQITGPTYTQDVAEIISVLLETEYFGVYHVSNGGEASTYKFLVYIAKQLGLESELITPLTSSQLKRPAMRPLHTTLISLYLEETTGIKMRNWEEAVGRMLN
jgi:dTDP-4-dehydrorhamnose reductase